MQQIAFHWRLCCNLSFEERVEELADVLEILKALEKLEGAKLEDIIKQIVKWLNCL